MPVTGPRWLNRIVSGATPRAGWTRAPREPSWQAFDVGQTGPFVDVVGTMKAVATGTEQSVVARIRVTDLSGKRVEGELSGVRKSQAAGPYFYPLELLVDGHFRYGLRLPKGATRLEIAVQHWRKSDRTDYFFKDVSVVSVDAIGKPRARASADAGASDQELGVAEDSLKAALRDYAAKLLSRPGPLWARDAVFGEPLVEYFAQTEGAADIAERLAIRRLKAGRDREAISLAGLTRHPMLDKAFGQRLVHEHWAEREEIVAAAPPIKARSLIYLLHNALPFDSGGYAARAHGLLRGYQKAGWQVHAFTRPGYPEDRGQVAASDQRTIDGVTYHVLSDDLGIDGRDQVRYIQNYADQVLSRMRGQEVGFVQAASFFHNAYAGRLIADRLNVPLVYEMRGLEWLTRGSNEPEWVGSDQAEAVLDLEIRAAQGADYVLAITAALRDWLIDQGVKAEKIGILPNGCSPDLVKPLARDEALASELGLSDAFVVSYIGSVQPYEGVETIVSAVALARTISGLDIRFLLVGDGRSMPVVEERIKALGAEDFVVLTGRVPHAEVARYYSITDAVALARLNLPLCQIISPLKPVEALAMGKFVITTDVAAISEIIHASQGGAIATHGPADAYAHAIVAAAENRSQGDRIASANRQWAIDNRDWEALAARALDEIQARFPRGEP